MATIARRRVSPSQKTALPMLQSGDRLRQPEFHRRYLQTPAGQKFELVEGRVVMASPVSESHAVYDSLLQTLLTVYRSQTLGTRNMANGTVILDEDNEVQPDACLWILPASGGRSRLKSGKYVTGAPEWVGEVSYSSVSIDLFEKRMAYHRNGIAEYFVVCIPDRRCHLFNLQENRPILPDSRGILRSSVMPGLWIDTRAFGNNDAQRVLATLQLGLDSKEHTAFVAQLAKTQKRRKGR